MNKLNKNHTIDIFGRTFHVYRISHRFVESRYFVSREIFPLNGQISIIFKIHLVFPGENGFGADYLLITTDSDFNGKLLFIRHENRPYYNIYIKIKDPGFCQIFVSFEDIELVSINPDPLTITDKEFSKIKEEIIKLYK